MTKVTIPAKTPKVHLAFRVAPKHAQLVTDLADAYGSTKTAVIETILDVYGTALLRDKRNETEKAK
jgi:hypothetical protein